MANSRKSAKRKSNVKSGQQPLANQKRNVSQKSSELEANTHSKRRRSNRYNLRDTSSVELICEIPCLQSAEQREKYTRLGLNTALFIKGSQCPKRKQSHISIITISSDDEETSEQRTTEWVTNLNQNHQSSLDPAKAQTFHPLSTSTPKTCQTAMQHPANQMSFTEASMLCETDCELTTSNENQSLSDPTKDKEDQDETFQMTITVPESLTDSTYVMEFQKDELDKTNNTRNIKSVKRGNDQGLSDDSNYITEFEQDELYEANTYDNITSTAEHGNDHGMSDDSNYFTEYEQDKLYDTNTYDNITSTVEQGNDQGMSDDSNYFTEFQQNDLGKEEESGSNLWAMKEKIDQMNGDTDNNDNHQCSQQCFNLASSCGLTSSSNFFKTSSSKETWPPNQFYFGPSPETKNIAFSQEFLVDSHPTDNNNPTDKPASDVFNFPIKSVNGGKEKTNEFCILEDNSVKNTNNEKKSSSLAPDDPGEVL